MNNPLTFKPGIPTLKIMRLETEEDLLQLVKKLNTSHAGPKYEYRETTRTIYYATDFPFASIGHWLAWYEGEGYNTAPTFKVFSSTMTVQEILAAMPQPQIWVPA